MAYCLRIVDVDPIRYRLLFERFLNPGRKQMPDIDMDFDERYRGEMIRYAAERYGWDRVAQIVTFSTIKARAAVRDAARVLGYPVQRRRPHRQGHAPPGDGPGHPAVGLPRRGPESYADGYKAAVELRQMCATDPDATKVVEVARGLEGLRRQDGIHAAAVVISGDPLTEHLPIQRKPEPGGRAEDAPIVTQYEMHGVEDLGLLKMDFLGLRNLSVIERALDLIEAATGERPDIDSIPLDDPESNIFFFVASGVGGGGGGGGGAPFIASYLGGKSVPTALYAASTDWGHGDDAEALGRRIDRAGGQLAAAVLSSTRPAAADDFDNIVSFGEMLGRSAS